MTGHQEERLNIRKIDNCVWNKSSLSDLNDSTPSGDSRRRGLEKATRDFKVL